MLAMHPNPNLKQVMFYQSIERNCVSVHPCQDHHSQPASAKINALKILKNHRREEVTGSSLSQKDEEDIIELV